ncbi:MAG: hydroxyacylglutathione hydrolase [Gammaproteobacteria bacterium]|nr:hydroxyacylglutathione hydrolase [Gammaproteobacteria bacterium]MBU1414903.1 hydroxyacylglutathione hydrolase [Gammaproteobacteria bacterium]
MKPLDVFPLPAFEDNYIWCLRRDGIVAVVDPGDAAPVLDHLSRSGDHLCAILITHHHRDHTGGIAELTARRPVPVHAPDAEAIAGTTHAVSGGDRLTLPELGIDFDVLDLAGHTRGHVGYYRPATLFCGDTLFGCGCGRLFEGTAAQLQAALKRIGALPRLTFAYCAHEYTASGIRFAEAVEPGNTEIEVRGREVARLRAAGLPTVPFTIADELATNPFLRCQEAEVIASVARRLGRAPANELEVFSALRAWRDNF